MYIIKLTTSTYYSASSPNKVATNKFNATKYESSKDYVINLIQFKKQVDKLFLNAEVVEV